MKETFKGANIRSLFSKNLRRLRGIANLSQVNLAAAANLTHNFVNDIENGKKWVSPETLAKLASALRVEPYQFFLSDAKWNNQGTELFSLFLNEFENSMEKIAKEYRNRFLNDEDNEKPETTVP